ncbi:hypothetical protein Ahy_B05g078157 [Arachis hypogaea]|uniref:Uncharacterized protein n=1 Tax=Arachis hypogaea TaxID=3818 RepID=A0A444Z6F4_ARAHY|nr:hypothetical protein Ahy_B05g078157 [Arachis hypogaea]
MVPNPNYVPVSTATTTPPSAQQHTVLTTPPPATNTAVLESSHGSQLADAPPPPPIVRMTIWPDGETAFAPNKNGYTQEMTNVIELMYDHPWPSYKKIPTETRERCFFVKLNFIWDKENDTLIKKIYNHRMGRQLQDVHERRDHLTSWLCWKIKKALHQRLTNRANRTSTRSSKYTGGSAIFMKTKVRLSKSLDRDATLAETFKYTHTLKENKERFADQNCIAQKLNKTRESYQKILTRVTDMDELRLEWRKHLERAASTDGAADGGVPGSDVR